MRIKSELKNQRGIEKKKNQWKKINSAFQIETEIKDQKKIYQFYSIFSYIGLCNGVPLYR
jgi:hypothetical protein